VCGNAIERRLWIFLISEKNDFVKANTNRIEWMYGTIVAVRTRSCSMRLPIRILINIAGVIAMNAVAKILYYRATFDVLKDF
jgi:hypothetical protein